MNKEQLMKMASDPGNISGIYNYCDRWCERCQFTSRCLNFQWGEEIGAGKEINDIRNEQFWLKMEEIFEFTRDLLKDMVEEAGIDLNAIELSEDEIRNTRERDELIENMPVALSAKAYSEITENWFDSSEEIVRMKEEELNRQISLGLPPNDSEREFISITDTIEVIRYYQHFISVKLIRALHSKNDKLPEPDDYPKDSDGSAKVALIAIDRSISALGKLLQYFPESEDEILDILVHLERLRHNIEKAFPEARNFIRPGFDEQTTP